MSFHVDTIEGFKDGVNAFGYKDGEWVQGEEIYTKDKMGNWVRVWQRSITFINTVNRNSANIFQLMGSPTSPRHFIFINRATIGGSAENNFSLRTGVFPAGSKLTIINESDIRGMGGNGGYPTAPTNGKDAIILDMPVIIHNELGTIFGGGGGGGYSYIAIGYGSLYTGGGGGAGVPAGAGGAMYQDVTAYGYTPPTAGTKESGGNAGVFSNGSLGGKGGNPGEAGQTISVAGGLAGRAIITNGNSLTIVSGNTSSQIKGLII